MHAYMYVCMYVRMCICARARAWYVEPIRAFPCIAISPRAHRLLCFSTPDILRSFVSLFVSTDCNCLRVYMHRCIPWYHADAKYLDYSAFAIPSTPIHSYSAGGWVAGCVYEAAGPKLKGIQLHEGGCEERGGGEGMQQSPTSERAYQRVILLVDAGVATSRRHWSIRDS